MIQSFVFLILFLISMIYLWIKRNYNYWNVRGLIQSDGKFPFGSLSGVGSKFTACEAMDMIYKNYKGKSGAIGIYFFLKPTLMVLDPEMLKKVFVRDFNSFHDRDFYYHKEADPTSANLLTLEGAEWTNRRKKLSPIFTSGKMKMMFGIIDSISSKLADSIRNKLKTTDIIEMRNWCQKYTADNIGNTTFGLECNCLDDDNSKFMKYGRRLLDLTSFETLKFFFTLGFPNFCKKLNVKLNPEEATEFFLNTFLQTFEYREKNNVNRNDFVSLLLALKDSFTPTELAAEAFLVFVGGFETSSTLMTFTLYELALNQEIQKRLRGEIMDSDEELTYENLNELKYLNMVINESLRKYPPIPTSIRKCTKDYRFEELDLTVEKGTSIEIPVYSLHNDPEYFPQPEKFDPERFNDENEKKIKPFTFIPFGEGNRQCIGMRFGLLQSKMGIVKLIKNFKFSPCQKTTIPMKFVPSAPFLMPEGGMWLKVEKIS